jgi:hypothetical protein
MTKTNTLRHNTKNQDISFVISKSSKKFMLVGRDYMVRVEDAGLSLNGQQKLRTEFSQSLPWSVVRRMFKNTKLTGKIHDGWPYRHIFGQYVTIGCQTFRGQDYENLREWAISR